METRFQQVFKTFIYVHVVLFLQLKALSIWHHFSLKILKLFDSVRFLKGAMQMQVIQKKIFALFLDKERTIIE